MKLKYSKSEIKMIIQLIPFFIPLGLIENVIFQIVWYSILGLSILYGLCNTVFYEKKNKYKNVLWINIFLTGYVFAQYISTIIYNGNWYYSLFKCFYLFSLCIIFQQKINKDFDSFLFSIDTILLISIIISAFCNMLGLFNPNGDFVSTYISIPSWLTIRIIRNIRNERKKDYLFYAIPIISVISSIVTADYGIYGDVSFEWTFFVELFVVLGAFCVWKINKMSKIFFDPTFMFGGVVIINLFFVLFQTFSGNGIIGFVLVNIMHKDITFSGRTGIWKMALSLISQSPIIGYGNQMVGYVGDGTYWSDFMVKNGAHNQFLEIMLFGGIISLALYIAAFIIVWVSLRKPERIETQFLAIGIFAILIELSFVYRQLLMCTPLFVLMIIAVNNKIINCKPERKI